MRKKRAEKSKAKEEDEAEHDEEADGEGGDLGDLLGDGPAEDRISVSEKFANKFNEKKDKMEAARAARVLADEDIASDSSEESSEDEDAELLTGRVENQIFETLSKIKAKDPSIYDSSRQFFADDDFNEENAAKTAGEDKSSSAKKMTYKNFLRDTLMKEGADAITREEEEMEGTAKKRKSLKTPAEEQRELQAEIRAAALGGDEDDEEGLFSLKEHNAEEKATQDEEFAKFQARSERRGDNAEAMMANYWRADDELDEQDRFLRDYIVNRQWLETASIQTGGSTADFAADDDEVEEEHLDEVDEFEKDYNFRFEVDEGKQIRGHARFSETSVRERNDKRKRQRKEKAERKEAEKVRRTEELKRLKNMKKQEIKRRLEQIKEITGNEETALGSAELDAEFDPHEHDQTMAAILGDDYDEQEEILASKDLVRAPDGCEELDVSGAVTEGLRKHWCVGQGEQDEEDDGEEWQGAAEDQDDEEENEEEEEHHPELWFLCDGCQKPIPGGKRRFDCTVCENYTLCMKCFRIRRHPHKFARKRVPESCMPPEDFKVLQRSSEEGEDKTIDDYFQLDYEDIIGGDLPTRFKYRKVEAKDYGIPARVVLSKTGKELNQMVSLKKLRTYRDEEGGGEEEGRWHKAGTGKGKGKGKSAGRGQEFAGQSKKKHKKGSASAADSEKVSASRLSAYNLEGDKFAGDKKHKPWQKKGKRKAKGSGGGDE